MRRILQIVVLVLLSCASVQARPELAVEVTDTGVINVDVGGTRCLEQFQVLLPWPDWKGGAGPVNCSKKSLAPGHVVVTGTLSDGRPCATFMLDSRESEGGVDLTWELTLTRDFEVETVRLNGLLPCSLSAGKGAWFVRRPSGLRSAPLPARLGEEGGNMGDWGFDWFGWLLPGDHGIRFRPRSGLHDMYLQDGRQWGGEYFQTCWTLAGKGTIRQGTVFRCTIRIEPLTGADLLSDCDRFGLSMLMVKSDLGPAATGGAQGQIEVRNARPAAQRLNVRWQVQDDVGAVLAQGKQSVEAPPLGRVQIKVASPEGASGEYRLHAEVRRSADRKAEITERRTVVPTSGPRASASLDGVWEMIQTIEPNQTAPPTGEWRQVTVPGRADSTKFNHCWYRRSFEVPTAMARKRLKLRFGAVNHEARVYVNGRLAGQHLGGNIPFEIGITDLVHPGANDLWVAVTNWTAACTKPPTTFEVGPFEHPGWKIPPGTIIAPIGGDFRLTGIWQSVSLLALPPVHVENMFIQTSVRRHAIHVRAMLRNESDQPRTVQMTNDIADRRGPAKSLPASSVTLAPGEVREVVVQARWERPHLWSLDDPHLYRLMTTLMEGGAVIDRLPTRFGFREVWTEGPHFVLNGVPMKLFSTSAWSMGNWEAARDHIARMKRAGTRCMRLHTQPWEECILDAADELGMLIADEAAVYCYAQSYAPEDGRFWENYAEHLRGLARRDRNHPSLAIYSLENEIMSCGGDPAKWEQQLGKMADIVRELDPSRLITCESDLDPANKMDIIGVHYPREYWAGYTLYPDKCWWLNDEGTYLGRKWKWKRDKPLYIGEFDGGFPAWYPQYQAFWLGDESYAARGRFSVSSPNSRARREMIAMEVQAYRYYGVTGMNPWFDPDEVEVFGPAAYAPITLAVRERTHGFYAGESISRTVYVCNDSFGPIQADLCWQASVTARQLQSGREALELRPCTAVARKIVVSAPAVAQRAPMRLTVTLRSAQKVLASTEQRLSLFPRPAPPRAASGVHLYDPEAKTAATLKRAGLGVENLKDLAALPKQARVVIIGANALKAGTAPWAESMARFVSAGGSVVCLEQTVYPAAWLPVEVELDPQHSSTIAFARARAHPALARCTSEDLRFWKPDHIVAHHSLLKPTRGNFVPVIDAGGVRGAINDMNGLNWAPLLELPHGAGRYLLCQLLLATRAEVEPAAALLLRDLIDYAAKCTPNTIAQVALVADPDSSLKRAVDGVSLVYDSLLGNLRGQTLAAHRVLIAGGGPSAWEEVRAHLSELREWVKQGGVLWLNNLSPKEADMLGELVDAKCELRSADVAPLCLAKSDPLTSGISNHELYWRDRPVWDQWTAMRRIMDFEVTSNSPAATVLTDPPGLVKVPMGKGCVLVNQLLWDSTDRNRLEGLRIASILLTNLGAQMDLAPFKPVRAEDFSSVDIAGLCNLGFAGDPGDGWMGHGPEALASFPLGEQTLARVPFRIINPADNGGKAVIALRGATRANYPAEVADIRVDRRARALHFLHTCAWGRPDGIEAATYVIHYEDGAEQQVPVRVGVEIADWYLDPTLLPYAQVAWKGHIQDKPGPIGVYAMRWVNPYPEKVISSIDFVSMQEDPVPVLIALSAEK